MKKILILGPSRPESMGALISVPLMQSGYCIALASRSGSFDYQCDITNPSQVNQLLSELRPDVVIHAAGILDSHQAAGQVSDFQHVASLLQAKALGSAVLIDAVVRHGVKTVIFFGGSEVSSDSSFWLYSIANGAMWSAVKAAAEHTSLDVFYFELGLVSDSKAGQEYLAGCEAEIAESLRKNSVSSWDVYLQVCRVLSGHYPSGSLVVINHGSL